MSAKLNVSEIELDAANRDLLRTWAREVGLVGYSSMRADALRNTLRAYLPSVASESTPDEATRTTAYAATYEEVIAFTNAPEPSSAPAEAVTTQPAVQVTPVAVLTLLYGPLPVPRRRRGTNPPRVVPPTRGPLPHDAPTWAKTNARTRRKWRRMQERAAAPSVE